MSYFLVTFTASSDAVLQKIEENTHFSLMPGKITFIISVIALVAAVFSAWYTWKTYKYQKQTEENTSRLSKSEQYRLLSNMIRHLYRNMVVSFSIKVKMIASNYNSYPSEEHLQKMKVLLDDIHLNLFYKNDIEHRMMNTLLMELRNYNLEIDVICQHLKNRDIDEKTKERDLGTLCFKCYYLTENIVTILSKIWNVGEDNVIKEAQGIIEDVIDEKNNLGGTPYDAPFEPYRNEDSFYEKVIFADKKEVFYNGFDENVRRECGMNTEKSDKIHMIKYAD